jgi:uncharacterized Ntn-hydrolase superfamily protein
MSAPARRVAAPCLVAALALAAGWCLPARILSGTATAYPRTATFSIVALDPDNGDLGIAVQSKFPNVRVVVPWARAGVGAVATQSLARLSYGTDGLDLMAHGASAKEALDILVRRDPDREQRQVGMVDAQGDAATWTGKECFLWAGGRIGREEGGVTEVGPESGGVGTVVAGHGFTVQGNILVSKETVEAMAKTFQATPGELAGRLVAALLAGGKAGGDQRGEQSAALLVVRQGAGYDGADNFVDISIYDHPTPLAELARLYELNRLYFRRSQPENMIPVTPEIARELQEIWKVRGFYDGPADGVVDAEFQKILVDFMGWENYDVRIPPVQSVDLAKGETLKIDREVLDDVRQVFKSGRWKPRIRR